MAAKDEYKSYECELSELDTYLNKASSEDWDIVSVSFAQQGRILVVMRRKKK